MLRGPLSIPGVRIRVLALDRPALGAHVAPASSTVGAEHVGLLRAELLHGERFAFVTLGRRIQTLHRSLVTLQRDEQLIGWFNVSLPRNKILIGRDTGAFVFLSHRNISVQFETEIYIFTVKDLKHLFLLFLH